VLGESTEQIPVEVALRHTNDREVIQENQRGFTKAKSCLTNPAAAYGDVTASIDKQRASDIIHLDFRKAIDAMSCYILLSQLQRHGCDGWTVRWTKNRPRDRVQRAALSGSSSGWRLVASGVPKGSVLGLGLFSICISDSTGGAGRTLREFADDTELWGAATQQRDGTPGDLVTAFRYLKGS